jgi:hypothetical protein
MAFRTKKQQQDWDVARRTMPGFLDMRRIAVAKHRNKTKGGSKHYKRWTEQEIAEIWRTELTSAQIALLLGRSLASIHAARYIFASKRPASYVHNGKRKADLTSNEKGK